MYTMCVIDDMKQVVDSIVRNVDWPKLGIQIVGTATNGESGMKLIKDTKPHIVLTDIRMPLIDGLEMVAHVIEHVPQVKIIIMSGYADFEYAQKAMRLGALDFIAKPMTPNELIQSVTKAKGLLDQEKLRHETIQQLQRQANESLPLMRQDYFNLLVRYFSTKETVQKRLDQLHIKLDKTPFLVMVAELDGYEQLSKNVPVSEIELIRFTVHNILEETIWKFTKGFVFRDYRMNQLICIMNVTPELDVNETAEQCRAHVERYSRYTVSIGIGSQVESVEDLPVSYQKALTALSYNFYTGGNSVFSISNVSNDESIMTHFTEEREKELVYALLSGNIDKGMEVLEQFFVESVDSHAFPKPKLVAEAYYELAYTIKKQFADKLKNDDEEKPAEILRSMKEGAYASLADLQNDMRNFYFYCSSSLQKDKINESHLFIERSIDYIRQNLHRGLTVNDCAKIAHLSPSYYANLFKKVTGVTFGQFIATERVEQAKKYLLEDIQVQEIASRLGFEDRPYFTEWFKKHVGMTPSEFKSTYIT